MEGGNGDGGDGGSLRNSRNDKFSPSIINGWLNRLKGSPWFLDDLSTNGLN